MAQRKLVIAGLVALSFILLIVSVLFFIDKVREQTRLDPLELESMTKEQILQTIYERHSKERLQFFYFIPLFGFFGVAVGAAIYFIFTVDLEKKDRIIQYDTKIILSLLGADERKVINKIVQSEGKVQQVEITYLEGFTKVKAHRVLERLIEKGLLAKEARGKVRLITLNKDIYRMLKK